MSAVPLQNNTINYEQAFARNIGWVTPDEQQTLRGKRIAIAGLGGVGGHHLLTLARMGFERFNLAEMDRFEEVNFNRQTGATRSTIDQPKLDVMIEMARDVNPGIEVNPFPDGVTSTNVNEFLDGADLYIDGLDFFAVEARIAVFRNCAKNDIPAITAAPLGMGAALLIFMPGKMTFEQYFRMDRHAEDEQLLRFLVGLAPSRLHAKYLVDASTIDLPNHKGPSTPMACQLCAGVAATNAVKVLLGRGDVPTAPTGLHFDAYTNQLKRTWRPWGNANPLQQLMLALGRRHYAKRRDTKPIQSSRPAIESG